jgi:hypothetical protein
MVSMIHVLVGYFQMLCGAMGSHNAAASDRIQHIAEGEYCISTLSATRSGSSRFPDYDATDYQRNVDLRL